MKENGKELRDDLQKDIPTIWEELLDDLQKDIPTINDIFMRRLEEELSKFRNKEESSDARREIAADTVNLFRAMYACKQAAGESTLFLSDIYDSIRELIFSQGEFDSWISTSLLEIKKSNAREIKQLAKILQEEFKARKDRRKRNHQAAVVEFVWRKSNQYGNAIPNQLVTESPEAEKSREYLDNQLEAVANQ